MKKLLSTALILVATFISSCSSQNSTTINGNTVKLENGLYAKMSTSMGDILIELRPDKAPMTVGNFVALAEGDTGMPGIDPKYKGKPFYNGITFHRVIPGFMIQGGDPEGTGRGGPGYKFPDETDNGLSHEKGVISMANSGPNTNGSQFFITVAPTKQLDGRHTVFGKVINGQNVADSISKVQTDNRDKPKTDVVINTVEIIRKGGEAKSFDGSEVFKAQKDSIAAKQNKRKARNQKQLQELKADAQKTESGLYYKVLEEGDGPKPEQGQKAQVHYAGYLLDGTLFDTSIKELAQEEGVYDERREPYKPFSVTIGPQARVIPGWKEGLQLMNVGDKYKLIIPPNLGYGARGAGGVIPPNAWLVFEVEMMGIEG